jgi:nucleotide-binding universal stress UspA family protein
VLVGCSAEAGLVVVGHRGTGGFAGLLAGSVALHTAAHALCPVVVVRGTEAAPDAPVVVGVDGSPESREATEFAFAAAARRGVPLVAVCGWPVDRVAPAADSIVTTLGTSPARYPSVELRAEFVSGRSPADAMVRAAERAGLVVVGSRGLSGLRGLLLGSVGRALIEHAPCPVAVVRDTR